MCFSAPVSFVTSGTLAALSGEALAKQKTKGVKMYALIPLLFSIQQAIEGFQWLTLRDGSGNITLGYAYLFFAFLLWPTYLPFAAYQLEKDPTRRRMILFLLLCGLITTALLLIALIAGPLSMEIVGHSIRYSVSVTFYPLVGVLYIMATCGSGLLVKRPLIQLFSFLAFISAAISFYVFQAAFTSVWCFFAAALSLIIIFEIKSQNK